MDETHVLRILIFAFSMQIWFFSQAWVQRHKSDFREIGNLINVLMKNGGKKKGKSKREQDRKEEREIERKKEREKERKKRRRKERKKEEKRGR